MVSSMETAFYKADRQTYPWWVKINPLWWFGNDEAKHGDSFYYLYIRNNLMNFKRFVIGVGDRDHWVSGRGPDPMIVMRSDHAGPSRADAEGWQWSVIWLVGVPLLPFVSYSGKYVEWYFGWQPWGEFAVKLTVRA
jgi:hypothetical protein